MRLLKTIGSVDFTGQERAALNKLTMPQAGMTGRYGALRGATRRVRDPPEASERPPGAVSDRWPGYRPRFGRSGPPCTEKQGVVQTGAKSLPRAVAAPKSDRLLGRRGVSGWVTL